MKVILKQSVSGLGQKGAILDVSEGYARNFLIPKRLAVPADSEEAKRLTSKIEAGKKSRIRHEKELSGILSGLEGRKFVFEKPATPEGALYAKLTAEEIAEEVARVTHLGSVKARKIELASPIKTVGLHEAGFSHAGKKVIIKIEVRAQNLK